MSAIQELFGKEKAIIAMAHFPPMPGQPLADDNASPQAYVDAVGYDIEILASSGVDAVIFCNEGDRPYRTKAGPEVPALMARVIAELRSSITLPFGVDILWDPVSTLALAKASGAMFVREVITGVYASDFGVWNTDPAETFAYRKKIGAQNVKILANINAEFAAPIAKRDVAVTARSVLTSSLPDVLCVSGAITGEDVEMSDLKRTREAVNGAAPVLANTGVKRATVGEILEIADGCVVGTALKRDGSTWDAVDRDRVSRFVERAAASGHWTPRT